MKKSLILAIMLVTIGFVKAQNFDKSLTGMYESTGSNDWISLIDNGTGELCISSDYMDLGCINFTWTSDEDQVFFKFKDKQGNGASKWSYWVIKSGIINLDFSTGFGPNLNFKRTN